MNDRLRRLMRAATILVLFSLSGCGPNDDRIAQLSQQSMQRQAEQNQLVAKNQEQMTDATKRLIEAEARHQQEHSRAKTEIRTAEVELQKRRDALEQERRQIAGQRFRDPIIAQTIAGVTGLFLASLPLIVAALLLWRLLPATEERGMAEVLIEEVVNGGPLFELIPHDDDPRRMRALPPPSSAAPAEEALPIPSH